MYSSVKGVRFGNVIILLPQLFMKNKVVDSQNKVADSISLVRETSKLPAVDIK